MLLVVAIIAARHAPAGRMDDAKRAMREVRRIRPLKRDGPRQGLPGPRANDLHSCCGATVVRALARTHLDMS